MSSKDLYSSYSSDGTQKNVNYKTEDATEKPYCDVISCMI